MRNKMMKLFIFTILLLLSFANGFECETNTLYSCSGHGTCISSGNGTTTCDCSNGHITKDCEPDVMCCHSIPARLPIFMAALFGGELGIPYFLIGEVGLGVGVIMMLIGTCIFGVWFAFSKENCLLFFMTAMFLVSWLAWWAASLICVAAERCQFGTDVVASW